MSFTPVFLTTDVLFFVLLAVALAYAWYASRWEHLRAPWRQVARNKRAVAAGLVLITFLLVGLLDSMHFLPRLDEPDANGNEAYASEMISVFDLLVEPLRLSAEKTYSAPLATRLFAKETIDQPDDSIVRDYPPLAYGGAHLDGAPAGPDIARRIAVGAFKGVLVSGVVIGLVWWWRRRGGSAGKSDVPWGVAIATFGSLAVLIGSGAELAGGYHVFGTDKVGTDVLYQALKSIRTGLLIGTLTTLIMLPFAVVLGGMAGYFRGLIDDIIQYLYTTLSSIPGVLLIAAAALILDVYMSRNADAFASLAARADLRLLALCIILGITSWTGLCRLLRAETLKLREIEFVQAARAFGVGHTTVMARHLLPNLMHIVMISIVLDFSNLVLAEAVLSYINIGVDPSMESWGNMINSARLELAREPVVWWSLAAAFVFMFALVLAANLFADAVRDAFDPRLRDGSH
ncbi:MAG: ABC transporter permease [Gammaproteobacteria bacterium]|nr:ABC transporter permease [Gammaproteobacteria bacterium]NNL99196.1 ABC transporter permease [Gammaproteobacteria bacterium]